MEYPVTIKDSYTWIKTTCFPLPNPIRKALKKEKKNKAEYSLTALDTDTGEKLEFKIKNGYLTKIWSSWVRKRNVKAGDIVLLKLNDAGAGKEKLELPAIRLERQEEVKKNLEEEDILAEYDAGQLQEESKKREAEAFLESLDDDEIAVLAILSEMEENAKKSRQNCSCSEETSCSRLIRKDEEQVNEDQVNEGLISDSGDDK